MFDATKPYQGYGLAGSHAWAFALDATASAWLRVHLPAALLAAILTEHPGMRSASTQRQEAPACGVPFLPIDLRRSGFHFRVERAPDGRWAGHPPLTAVRDVSAELARTVMCARLAQGPFGAVAPAARRVAASRRAWEALAHAGAFDAIAARRNALDAVGTLSAEPQDPQQPPTLEAMLDAPAFATLAISEQYVCDHAVAKSSTLELHALRLIRDPLTELAAITLWQLRTAGRKSRHRPAGLVASRQRPGTAKRFAFFVIEDGPTRGQLIVSPDPWDSHRAFLRDASVLLADVAVEDAGYQLSLPAERPFAPPAPIHVRGYHDG